MFGDSLAAGAGIDPASAYPALLQRDFGLPVIALGQNGDTTESGLARFDRDVPPHRPFLVVVELGGNDFTHRVPQSATFRNIEQLVLKVHRLGAVAVVAAVDTSPIGDSYGDGYRDIARRYGAGVVTGLLNDVLAKPRYMVDSIHPNAEGHTFLAARMAAVLRPILERMPTARRLQHP